MEAKFTPTEWQRAGTTVYALNLEGSNRFSALVQGGWATDGRLRTDDAELVANARLIAAAPDSHNANLMFVAAINDAYQISPDHSADRIYDELPSSSLAAAYFVARAAISKATGEQA